MVSPCSSWFLTRLAKQEETIPEPFPKINHQGALSKVTSVCHSCPAPPNIPKEQMSSQCCLEPPLTISILANLPYFQVTAVVPHRKMLWSIIECSLQCFYLIGFMWTFFFGVQISSNFRIVFFLTCFSKVFFNDFCKSWAYHLRPHFRVPHKAVAEVSKIGNL